MEGHSFCLARFPGESKLRYFAEAREIGTGPSKGSRFIARDWSGKLYLEWQEMEPTSDADLREDHAGHFSWPDWKVDLQSGGSYASYAREFAEAMGVIANSELKKLVLSRVKTKVLSPEFDVFELLLQLEKAYPQALVHLMAHPSFGIWVGASPEVLLKGVNGHWHTYSLAGTRKAGSEDAWPKKELEEQEFVSEHIRSVLVGRGMSFTEKGPYTVEAGAVEHLCTQFDFEKLGVLEHLPQELHPTPAVAGLPVADSRKAIERVEQHQRGLYTGYLGCIDPHGGASLYVNLRCAQLWKDRAALYLGGGLTTDSELEKEWSETELKALTLEKFLA